MIKTRFAPSPTGFLHLGGARTALFNWLLAKQAGGHFVLRIEDTDEARSTGASADEILRSLEWLGLTWDEGPFYQSKRLPIYRDHLRQLIDRDLAYPAFDTADELYAARIKANDEGRTPIYDGDSKRLTKADGQKRIKAGEPHVWRLRTPDSGIVPIHESLQGKGVIPFPAAAIEDFVLTRPATGSDVGMPLYNFVCAIDDALMGITDVIRGVEHLGNSPKQALIYGAFGYTVPRFTHLPLIFKRGKKMSKRDADADKRFPVSVEARRELGILPEAMINHLALLGWSHPKGKEVFDRDELLRSWSRDRLGKTNANFDEDKFAHVNKAHMRMMNVPQLALAVMPFMLDAGMPKKTHNSTIEPMVALEQHRCKALGEFPEALSYFFREPVADAAASALIASADGQRVITLLFNILNNDTSLGLSADSFETVVKGMFNPEQMSLKDVSQPIRAALTGRLASPGLFDVMALLGRDTVLARLKKAVLKE